MGQPFASHTGNPAAEAGPGGHSVRIGGTARSLFVVPGEEAAVNGRVSQRYLPVFAFQRNGTPRVPLGFAMNREIPQVRLNPEEANSFPTFSVS